MLTKSLINWRVAPKIPVECTSAFYAGLFAYIRQEKGNPMEITEDEFWAWYEAYLDYQIGGLTLTELLQQTLSEISAKSFITTEEFKLSRMLHQALASLKKPDESGS